MFPDNTIQATAADNSADLNQNNCAWTPEPDCVKTGGSSSPINLTYSAVCKEGGYVVGSKTTICFLSQCSSDYCAKIGEKVQAYCCYPDSFVFLYSKKHTPLECTNSGGTVESNGSESFCRFSNSSCPSGWTQYNNYSKTVANTCSGTTGACTNLNPRVCTTGYHEWSNIVAETCSYYNQARNFVCPSTGARPLTCTAKISQIGCY
jgi:hypothetical protein